MSQEKVELKKEKKRHAKQRNSRKKALSALATVCVVAICIGIAAWIGTSIYNKQQENQLQYRIAVNPTAIDNYIYSIE